MTEMLKMTSTCKSKPKGSVSHECASVVGEMAENRVIATSRKRIALNYLDLTLFSVAHLTKSLGKRAGLACRNAPHAPSTAQVTVHQRLNKTA